MAIDPTRATISGPSPEEANAPAPPSGPPRFVTYAQNFEDVMLWRALKSQPPGFYIDVGAADPVRDSVTNAFYQRGWRGMNIEPAPTSSTLLSAARGRDVNLQCLAGAESGTARFYLMDDGGGFSTMDVEVARRHQRSGMSCKEVSVPVETLADLCARHVSEEVHFLKIDVEGAESEVLRGADLARWRPWIILLEATYPNTARPSHADWEPYLLSRGYRYVYFDGLNRFYVAEERFGSMAGAFERPPSPVLDWFMTAGEADALARAASPEERAALAGRLALAESRLLEESRKAESARAEASHSANLLAAAERDRDLAREAAECAAAEAGRRTRLEQAAERQAGRASERASVAESQAADLRAHLAAVLSSHSWRVTAPLRAAATLLRGEARGGRRRGSARPGG